MANIPETSPHPDQPERGDEADWVAPRAVHTQGGDYAEGNIDSRQGTFIGRDQYTTNITYATPRGASPVFQVPYQPIPLIGRDEALAELTALLTGDAPVVLLPAIAGMGGVGKTLLAATFAHRHQAAFPGGVFWLNMEQPDQIAGQVAACAGPGGLDLPDFSALSFDDRIARVRAAWNSPARRLLVFDNLEDPTLLTSWQPTGNGTRVLITTRRDDWPRQVRRMRLPVLLRPRSIELLLTARASDQGVPIDALLGDPAESAAADAICDLLGDLPLALAIAAALLRLNPSLSLRSFQGQITADPLLSARADATDMHEALREAGLPTGRAMGVTATFAISYRQLQATNVVDVRALLMLHAAAYCAPAPIPQEVLWQVAGLNPASENDRAAGDAATRRLRALGLFGAPSLDDLGTITLHRLLAAFVCRQLHPREVLGTIAAALVNHTFAMRDAGQIKRSVALNPHLETVLMQQAETLGAEHVETLRTAHNLALTLYSQWDYAGARARYEEVLAIQTRIQGAEHPDALRTAINLASTLYRQGNYAASRARYEAILAAHTRILGAEHPNTLGTAMGLASALYSQGDYAGARARYEEVLVFQTRILGAEHPDTLSTAMGLANTLLNQGDAAGARTRYEAVLEIQTHTLGAEHPDTLYTAGGLANTLLNQGDYAGACARYEVILEIQTRTSGAEHPHTLSTAMGLANTLAKQGYYAEARARYEAILEIQTRTSGAEHPDTLSTAMGLANTLAKQGYYAEARARYEAILGIQTRTSGAEHPDTLSTAMGLANTLEKIGRWQAAARLQMQVVVSSERRLDLTHPDGMQYLFALSRNLNARGYQRTARQLLKKRLKQLPDGIWRNAVQFSLVFARVRAVLTPILLGWIASKLVEHAGGLPLQVIVVGSAVLSYWSRWAQITLFALAGAALATSFSSGLPMPWLWACLVLAALFTGGLVPYGAPVIAWMLSATRVRLLIQPIQRRIYQLGQRGIAWAQSETAD